MLLPDIREKAVLVALSLISILFVGISDLGAEGPMSLTTSLGVYHFNRSPYFQASEVAGLGAPGLFEGARLDPIWWEYRVRPTWSISQVWGGPFWPVDAGPPGFSRSVEAFTNELILKYFLVRAPYQDILNSEVYIGAGPVIYEISEERPGALGGTTEKKEIGGVFVVGGEIFMGEIMGILLEAKYNFVSPIATPLGELDVSGFSFTFGPRFHFGGS